MTTPIYSFTLNRGVTNWDTCFLERKIRDMVIFTKYKGNIEITFPITYSKVVILRRGPNPLAAAREVSSTTRKQKWRRRPTPSEANTPIISHNAVYAYDAIQVIWPYASNAPSPPPDSTSSPSSNPSRQCLVQSEQDWLSIWAEPVRNGVLNKKHGWVTVEDWKEAAMGVKFPEPNKSWGNSVDDWHVAMKSLKWSDRDAASRYLSHAKEALQKQRAD